MSNAASSGAYTGALVPFLSERDRFKSGESSPRALLERCIEVIEVREETVQAFVRTDLDAARRAADAATDRYRSNRTLSEIDGTFLYDGPLEQVARTYANQKVITAHLRTGERRAGSADLARFGEVLEAGESEVKLCVDRDRVADASAFLLERLPVADLAIDEEDIGTIIERIFRERRVDAQ